jgi:tetratricopeptide (TPR) repeat protein
MSKLAATTIWPAILAAALLPLAGLPAQEPASDAAIPADPLAPLAAKLPRSEADQDRIAAAALFTHGRLLQDRGDLAEALSRYERAWRYDPAQESILREIAPLAFELKRTGEAARYAVLAAERNPHDPVLLRRLAQYLTEQRDWKRAITLNEKSLALAKPADGPLDLAAVSTHFELGRLYFLTDDFVRSAQAFANVRDALADPNSPLSPESKDVILGKPSQTWSLWGEAFLAAGRHDEAAALFKQADEAARDPAGLAFNLARVAAAKKDNPATLARLDEYFSAKTDAAGIEPYELLATLLDRPKTIERLEALRKDQPDNGSLAISLAGQFFQADRLDDAAKLFEAALAKKPSGEAYRRLVEIYQNQEKPQELLRVAGKVVRQTGALDVLGEVGKSLAVNEKTVTKVVDHARARLNEKADALSPDELFAIGLLAAHAKKYDAAGEFVELAIAADKSQTGKVLLRWGIELLTTDQFDRSAKAFQRMLDEKTFPTGEANVHFHLAFVLEMLGKTDEALAHARLAASLDEGNTRLAGRPAWVLYHAKRYDAARQAQHDILKKHDARKAEPDREIARQARLALSNIELERGDFPAAVEWLEQVLDEFPEDAGANNDLGYLWSERGLHLVRSLAMIERAVAAEPENTAYRDSLGWAYFQLGRYDEAEKELAHAAQDEDADGVILEHWGDALAKLGRKEDARGAWKRAEAAFQTAGESGKLKAVQKKLQN